MPQQWRRPHLLEAVLLLFLDLISVRDLALRRFRRRPGPKGPRVQEGCRLPAWPRCIQICPARYAGRCNPLERKEQPSSAEHHCREHLGNSDIEDTPWPESQPQVLTRVSMQRSPLDKGAFQLSRLTQ